MSNREIIGHAHMLAKDIRAYIRARPDAREGFFGYNCFFVPEEILHAAGFIPVRLLGEFGNTRGAERYIPSHCCEFVRNIVGAFEEQRLDFLAGAAFGFCCDTLRVAADILTERNYLPIFQLNLPMKLSGGIMHRYLLEEISLFKKKVEEQYRLVVTDEALEGSLKIYEENTNLLQRLSLFIRRYPQSLSAADYQAVASMGYYMPREEHNRMLEIVLQDLADTSGAAPADNGVSAPKKIILSGFINNNLEIIRWIEGLGVCIIEDDLCEGARYWNPVDAVTAVDGTSPLERVADRMLRRFCPVKHEFKPDYSEMLIKKFKENQARGIIVLTLKFCDPQSMEYAAARLRLAAASVPVLILEWDGQGTSLGQMETRLEAFIESI